MTIVGMNTHIPMAVVLDKVQYAGIKHIRCDFNWDYIEPAKGFHKWGITDQLVEDCEELGISILPTIGYTPVWANDTGKRNDPPTRTANWINFVYRIVRRYPQISYWSIWNEPNISDFFSGSIKDYGHNILAPAAKAIHELNKMVVAPGIATTHSGWSKWLNEMLWYRAKGFLDVLSIHHYTAPASEAIRLLEKGTWLGRHFGWLFPDRRAILPLAKRACKRVWLTEIGWSTAPQHVTEEQQQQYYEEMIEWDSSLERIYFYEMVDDPSIFVKEKFGILRSNLNGKKTYTYLKEL